VTSFHWQPEPRVGPLTQTEHEALIAVAEGLSAVEYAAEIGVPEHRVKHKLEQARRKLGAKTTAHAVALAYHEGLILAPARARRDG
jgi:DNA-binding CsgD family transcriptional regulator